MRIFLIPVATLLLGGTAMAQTGPAFQGGMNAPASSRASNIAPGGPSVAPRLPAPGTPADEPRQLLQYAQESLRLHRSGAAQEALERAQTRILSRTVEPGRIEPDTAAMSRAIAEARRALGARNIPAARAAIDEALRASVPPTGPGTVTMPYGTPVPPGVPTSGPLMAPPPPPPPGAYAPVPPPPPPGYYPAPPRTY